MHENEIQQVLEKIRIILEGRQEGYWADYFSDLEEEFRKAIDPPELNRERKILQRISEIFGGMGSFNDVFINVHAGHNIKPEEVSTVNRELGELRSRLYVLVEAEKSRLSS